MSAVSSGDVSLMEDSSREIEAAGKLGNPAAQSVMGFLYGMGFMKEKNKAEKNYTKCICIFFPLERVVRALRFLQKGSDANLGKWKAVSIPHGTL
ncbi:hypothetical protein K1719_043357 [Acacia pycnantha]|nr:hypothetical protein K1719_043357 [Acacia pycnantha]